MAGAKLAFATNTCTIISASCPFRPTCCAGRFARTPGAALVCDLSISNLNWVRKLRGEESVSIFAVALSYTELQSVEAFLERNALDVPVLLGTPELLNSYRIRAFPTVYALNESGNIDGSTVGYATTLGLWWRTL